MTPLYHPRPERWPQFGLKGLFVLVTVLCVSLGWVGVQLKWIRDRHEALKSLPSMSLSGSPNTPAPWSIRLLESGVPVIGVEPEMAKDEDKVRALRRLFPESKLFTTVDEMPWFGPHRGPHASVLMKKL